MWHGDAIEKKSEDQDHSGNPGDEPETIHQWFGFRDHPIASAEQYGAYWIPFGYRGGYTFFGWRIEGGSEQHPDAGGQTEPSLSSG